MQSNKKGKLNINTVIKLYKIEKRLTVFFLICQLSIIIILAHRENEVSLQSAAPDIPALAVYVCKSVDAIFAEAFCSVL